MDTLTIAIAFIATQFQRICVHQLEISVVSEGSSPPSKVETILEKVVSLICPNQCNGNGNCQNGVCVCNTGEMSSSDCLSTSLCVSLYVCLSLCRFVAISSVFLFLSMSLALSVMVS